VVLAARLRVMIATSQIFVGRSPEI